MKGDLVIGVFQLFRQYASFYFDLSLAPRNIFLAMISCCDNLGKELRQSIENYSKSTNIVKFSTAYLKSNVIVFF